jgi:hypothetical protein
MPKETMALLAGLRLLAVEEVAEQAAVVVAYSLSL